MHMMLINPEDMSLAETTVDLKDFRAIQRAIGGRSYETIRAAAGTRLFVDANARVRPERPSRFFLPNAKNPHEEPLAIYGKALLVVAGSRSFPEIAFSQEQRVTFLDRNWQTLGCFVSTAAGRDPSNINFQATLSDERFVAATRVILSTFEPHVLNAVPSHSLCPMLELEIDDQHVGAALDLYDEVLAILGYKDEGEDEDEEEQKEIVW